MMFRKQKKDALFDAETQPSLNPIFKACWKVKTAPKIQIFRWKALHGSLVVTERLQTRAIRNFDGCMFCNAEMESINHILFLCPFARQVWALSNIPSPFLGFGNSIFENMYHLFSLKQMGNNIDELKSAFAWILWHLWKTRNSLLFEGFALSSDVVVQKALDVTREWSAVHSQDISHKQTLLPLQEKWYLHAQGEVKCNIGFSWSKRLCLSGASWVIRDHNGKVILHSRGSYSSVVSTFDAKLKSWEWALESMANLHLENVTFCASTMDIIKAMHNPSQWPALIPYISPLIMVAKNKPNWFLFFELTDCNNGALLVAQSVTSDLQISSYVARGAPTWLIGLFDHEQSLLQDCNLMSSNIQ
ncbi:PREDICTED: uncharacterized protein LOC109127621 [Camelina sativa]|uniref:Uncharacterized protein LOC109127621 n=1 Tax=Camelina sativa TaxID=90675 RepID=A0ABM1QN33_CAMSA|nr:PREDICTED: uncharacterized protein LOC109127621 [Camelina sativa]